MAISLPITSRTSSDDNDFADVYANDSQLVTEIDARDSVYKTLLFAPAVLGGDQTAATYILGTLAGPAGLATVMSAVASGADVVDSSGGACANLPPVIYFDDADYSVSSKTQKLRVRAQVLTNATAPAITFTVALYPVTVAGGSDALTFTLGTAVSGSTVAIASPSASAVTQGTSGDLTIPSDGAYALGVVTSGTIANNAASLVYGYLQTRHV